MRHSEPEIAVSADLTIVCQDLHYERPARRASGIGAQREFPKLAQPSHVAPKALAMSFNSARVATTPA